MNVPDHDAAESDPLATTLAIYRESLPNDRSMFNALIVDWSALSPAHRALVYKIGDRLAKRRGVAQRFEVIDPGGEEQGLLSQGPLLTAKIGFHEQRDPQRGGGRSAIRDCTPRTATHML